MNLMNILGAWGLIPGLVGGLRLWHCPKLCRCGGSDELLWQKKKKKKKKKVEVHGAAQPRERKGKEELLF